jgi:cyclopropane-fatty-acyl-phospholipid synthase
MDTKTLGIEESYTFGQKIQNSLVQAGIDLIENGLVPDFLTRVAIRRLLKKRIQESNSLINVSGNCENYLKNYKLTLSNSPLAIMTNEANSQHYEVPTAYYDYALGENKKYSSCFWPTEIHFPDDLNLAEKMALEESIKRAEIVDGMKILELGCGWGSLSLYLAKKFPNSTITAVSNSKTQKMYIENRARENNLNNIKVLTKNLGLESSYAELGEDFDRIMSVEMMEHLRNYELFFQLISKVLKPRGKFFIHIFVHKDTPYFFETKGSDNWMGKYFFSGGQMPSLQLFQALDIPFSINSTWTWNGMHYQKTLEAWLKLHDKNKSQIISVFKETYKDEAKTWFYRWRMFYLACSELFGYNRGEEWKVAHYLLEKK